MDLLVLLRELRESLAHFAVQKLLTAKRAKNCREEREEQRFELPHSFVIKSLHALRKDGPMQILKSLTCVALTIVSLPVFALGAEPSPAELAALKANAMALAASAVSCDQQALLTADKPDFTRQDRADFQRPSSDLYKYVLGGCDGRTPNEPSVHRTLSSMKKLDVVILHLNKRDKDSPYFMAVFFDSAKLQPADIRLSTLCRYRNQLVSWTFEYHEKGDAWVSSHAPFDAQTDLLCPPND